jgi:ribulose bisphosphate carboxylase small subunit
MMTNPTGRLTQGQFSFLPDLTDAEITMQIEYGLKKGYAWSIEYTDDPHPRNTYWDMYGHPNFDLEDAAGVMMELKACRQAFPEHYIRMLAFDSTRGVETGPPRSPASTWSAPRWTAATCATALARTLPSALKANATRTDDHELALPHPRHQRGRYASLCIVPPCARHGRGWLGGCWCSGRRGDGKVLGRGGRYRLDRIVGIRLAAPLGG